MKLCKECFERKFMNTYNWEMTTRDICEFCEAKTSIHSFDFRRLIPRPQTGDIFITAFANNKGLVSSYGFYVHDKKKMFITRRDDDAEIEDVIDYDFSNLTIGHFDESLGRLIVATNVNSVDVVKVDSILPSYIFDLGLQKYKSYMDVLATDIKLELSSMYGAFGSENMVVAGVEDPVIIEREIKLPPTDKFSEKSYLDEFMRLEAYDKTFLYLGATIDAALDRLDWEVDSFYPFDAPETDGPHIGLNFDTGEIKYYGVVFTYETIEDAINAIERAMVDYAFNSQEISVVKNSSVAFGFNPTDQGLMVTEGLYTNSSKIVNSGDEAYLHMIQQLAIITDRQDPKAIEMDINKMMVIGERLLSIHPNANGVFIDTDELSICAYDQFEETYKVADKSTGKNYLWVAEIYDNDDELKESALFEFMRQHLSLVGFNKILGNISYMDLKNQYKK